MELCVRIHADLFNTWLDILFNSRRVHVAVVPGITIDLRLQWHWCLTVFSTLKNRWPAAGGAIRPGEGGPVAREGGGEQGRPVQLCPLSKDNALSPQLVHQFDRSPCWRPIEPVFLGLGNWYVISELFHKLT